MFVLDYKLSGKTGTEASTRDYDVSKLTLTNLHYDGIFIGDVIFKTELDGSTLVDFGDYRGYHPVLYFAESLYLISEELATSESEQYSYPDDGQEIWFRRNDGQLHVITNYTPGSLVVDFDEFKKKAEDLFLKAYKNFIDLYPTAVDSPAILDVKKNIARIEEKHTNI